MVRRSIRRRSGSRCIFGDYNPAGRLPITFYKNVNDLPDFENYSMENRTYRYFRGAPLYPFGFGLSYTTFEYSDLKVEKKKNITLKVTLSNKGDKDGDEVVQLYISQKNQLEKTPIRTLKGFKRVHLKAKKSTIVTFELDENALSYIDSKGEKKPMTGNIEFSIGGQQPQNNKTIEGTIKR